MNRLKECEYRNGRLSAGIACYFYVIENKVIHLVLRPTPDFRPKASVVKQKFSTK